jgi:hypothetical protein
VEGKAPVEACEVLSDEQFDLEALALGLRTSDGVPLHAPGGRLRSGKALWRTASPSRFTGRLTRFAMNEERIESHSHEAWPPSTPAASSNNLQGGKSPSSPETVWARASGSYITDLIDEPNLVKLSSGIRGRSVPHAGKPYVPGP